MTQFRLEKYYAMIEKMSTEMVYLENAFEDMVFRREPGGEEKWFAKKMGGKEYEIRYNSNLVADTKREYKEITKEQYDKY
jgi:hypothetical protein